MSVDIKICLNGHATAPHIFEVILKSVGHEFRQEVLDYYKEKKIDFSLPPSESNPWHLRPVEDDYSEVKPTDITYFNVLFKDMAGGQYNCLLHLENEDNHLGEGKELNPKSTATWAAIGKRLVDFFGGQMLYEDTMDFDNLDNWYISKNPMFPKKNKEQRGNDRWHQYYQALNELPMITSQEIIEMAGRTAYWNDRDEALVDYLEKYEEMKKLSDSLNEKPLENNHKRLKI